MTASTIDKAAAQTILEELQDLQEAFWDKASELEHALDLDIDDLCIRDLAGLTIDDLLPSLHICDCGAVVTREDSYFATPCGTSCDECMKQHALGCEICASEFGLPYHDESGQETKPTEQTDINYIAAARESILAGHFGDSDDIEIDDDPAKPPAVSLADKGAWVAAYDDTYVRLSADFEDTPAGRHQAINDVALASFKKSLASPARTEPRFSHLFSIGFDLHTDNPADQVTEAELFAAIRRRIADLERNGLEILEACGVPLETTDNFRIAD